MIIQGLSGCHLGCHGVFELENENWAEEDIFDVSLKIEAGKGLIC